MIAPLTEYGRLGAAGSLVAALLIGIAFGWCLERGGMGSATKLMGQFRLTDLTLFRLMFSAILTAMLGAFWLSRLGLLDLARVHVPATWLVPQLLGGVIFGAGFGVAGLCPGTSCVAAVTGRLDGAAVVAGFFAGALATGLALPALRPVFEATARGARTLPDATGLPYGLVMLVIVALALGGFNLAPWVERRMARAGRAA